MNEVILVDFDGTIVEHKYPLVGDPLPDAFEVLKELQAAGYKLILWTCRENDGYKIDKQYLKEAIELCSKYNLVFDAINETIQDYEFRSEKVNKRKPYAHHQIDDTNLGGFPGWNVVRQILLEKKSFKLQAD